MGVSTIDTLLLPLSGTYVLQKCKGMRRSAYRAYCHVGGRRVLMAAGSAAGFTLRYRRMFPEVARTSPRAICRASWPASRALRPPPIAALGVIEVRPTEGLALALVDRPCMLPRPVSESIPHRSPSAFGGGEAPTFGATKRVRAYGPSLCHHIIEMGSAEILVEDAVAKDVMGGSLPRTWPPTPIATSLRRDRIV